MTPPSRRTSRPGPVTWSSGSSGRKGRPCSGSPTDLRRDLVGARLRRVRHGRVLPPGPRVALLHQPADRPGLRRPRAGLVAAVPRRHEVRGLVHHSDSSASRSATPTGSTKPVVCARSEARATAKYPHRRRRRCRRETERPPHDRAQPQARTLGEAWTTSSSPPCGSLTESTTAGCTTSAATFRPSSSKTITSVGPPASPRANQKPRASAERRAVHIGVRRRCWHWPARPWPSVPA